MTNGSISRPLLIRADGFRSLLEFIEANRGDAQRVLDRVDCPMEMFDGNPSFIPIHTLGAVLEAASHECQIDCLGVEFARFAGLPLLVDYGDVLFNLPTLRAIIEWSGMFIHTHTQGSRIWHEEQGDLVHWCYSLHPTVIAARDIGHQIALVAMHDILHHAWGPGWPTVSVRLEQPPPRSLRIMHRALGRDLAFGTNRNCITFDRARLDVHLPIASSAAPETLSQAVDRMLERSPKTDIMGIVGQLIQSSLTAGSPTLEKLARLCLMSPRTLQRKLKEHDIAFSDLVQLVRLTEAKRLLMQPGSRITRIALDLGYRDVANFSHAFQRWTGMSPSDFRSLATARPPLGAAD